MNDNEKLELLAEAMGIEADRLNPDQYLSGFSEWDSLASLSFMSILVAKFKRRVTSQNIKELETVRDAIDLME